MPKEKATMVVVNGFGFLVSSQIWLHEHEVKVDEWKKKTLRVKFTPKGKRKVKHCRFEDILLIKGWKEVKDDFNTPDEQNYDPATGFTSTIHTPCENPKQELAKIAKEFDDVIVRI